MGQSEQFIPFVKQTLFKSHAAFIFISGVGGENKGNKERLKKSVKMMLS